MTKPLVCNLLSKASNSNSSKRRRFGKRRLISDAEYPKMTSNMVGDFQHGGSKHHTKQVKREATSFSSEESDIECSSGLKEKLIELEGTYRHTQIRTRAIFPIDYNSLVRGIETNDEHSAIVGSHSSNSYRETEAFAYMADVPEEIARKFEEQTRV